MTVDAALAEATRRLADAGIETASLDAELLLRHALGWDRAAVLTRGRDPFEPAALERFLALVAERARRRPLQHLTGVQAFWRHEFRVTPDVLIPRPETELLVEVSLELLRDRARPVVVDVGTGTGCIALSLAAERPDAEVHAIDLSAAALDVARDNARRLGLEGRIAFHQGDLLAPVTSLAGRVDLVVSNPPYVTAEEWTALAPEVRDHDPRIALVPPEGVAELYQRLFAEAARALDPGAHVAVEVGVGQAGRVIAAAREAGLDFVEARLDLQQLPRVVVARRNRAVPVRR